MAADLKPVSEYIKAIEKELVAGNATEPSHYPALKALIQGLGEGVTATNNPKQIECGAPDFVVAKGQLTIGYIEAKDIGVSLEMIEKSEQLGRYRHSLPNLILTNFLEFRWYQNGERTLRAKLGTVTDGKVKPNKQGREEVAQLLADFFKFDAPGVGTPKELAVRMARLAHRIREGVEEALVKGVASDLLSGLYKAFQETLIPGLEIKVFADMYAQTITYGLFAARCETDDASKFTLKDATDLIPKTNPFLKDLFYQITGPHLNDEPYKWAVDELVQVLKKADMTEIVRGLSKGTGKDDPVVYFYEDFLREYDKKISEMRGVYYTPMPVVSYIVSSISYLLKNRFNRPQGLADENTYILDPATGTGTFLYAVINEIYESMSKQGQMGKWDGYVAKHLLPRIFGFELLMAPYVIAHLKLGLQLRNTGYTFQSKERLGVYLTNTLEEAVKSSEMLMAQYIVKEAHAPAEIKKEKKIMVVLGNPPYSGISANRGKWITGLIDGVFDKDGHEIVKGYKRVDGQPLRERKLWLQDDYVKFIRFGQWRIERTGQGALGFITNHAYLDNPTFRGMRKSLLSSFTDIYILNLHGNAKKKEVAPDGSKDENVFDIEEGVSIGIFVKESGKNGSATVHYADLWGLRDRKYQFLTEADVTSTKWIPLEPDSPLYLFVPHNVELRPEYKKGWLVTDIFPIHGPGMTTARDGVVINFEQDPLFEKATLFRDSEDSNAAICERLGIPQKIGWNITQARQLMKVERDLRSLIKPVLYRPFDTRLIFYHDSLVWRTVKRVMQHMLHNNIGLVCPSRVETVGPWQHVLCAGDIVDHVAVSLKTIDSVFPLYLYPTEGEMRFEKGRRPNLNPDFIKAVTEKLGLKFIEDGKGDLTGTLGPEDIFNYAYAVFHSPTYRTRYAEFLKMDFPRLPLTSDKELFKALVEKGSELVSLHLMESPALNNHITGYPVTGSNTVEKVSYDDNNQRVQINKTQYFEGIPREVWEFRIGGYQVAEKWLKDRKGGALTYDELTHYQKVIVALKKTIRLMEEIDELIPGWPME